MFITDATNLPRIMNCNGSRLMQPSFPKPIEDTTVRDEGNAAHFMALSAFNDVHTVEELIDRKAPNGVYMTPEMAEHVQEYLDYIRLRHPVTYAGMEVTTTFGNNTYRVDARADSICETVDTLYVDDFKYGWRLVEPLQNWTLVAHAVGHCLNKQITPAYIVFTIYQPRPHHPDGTVRTWSITYLELLELYAQINATMSNPNDELHTGAHCAKCPALATCPAARASSMNAIDASEMAFNEDVDNATLAFAIDQYQRAKSMIESRLKASEELAMHRIKLGQIIDDFGAEMQYTNRRWKSAITVEMMTMLTGKDLSVPKMPTLSQAKKAGVPETVIDTLTERIPTGMKLIRASADQRASRILGTKS